MNAMNCDQRSDGFLKAGTVKDWESWIGSLPNQPGVYAVIRKNTDAPVFVKPGTGGYFKGEDPNVEIETLQAKWNNSSHTVMYIGRAGYDFGHPEAQSCKSTLQRRLKDYMRFGRGEKAGHRGGRYIWQLKDADELEVWYLPCDNPQTTKRELIELYRPFANL